MESQTLTTARTVPYSSNSRISCWRYKISWLRVFHLMLHAPASSISSESIHADHVIALPRPEAVVSVPVPQPKIQYQAIRNAMLLQQDRSDTGTSLL